MYSIPLLWWILRRYIMPEGLSKYEWEFFMECMYDTMPKWYWNTSQREKEYQRYKDQSNEG